MIGQDGILIAMIGGECLTLVLGCSPGVGLMGPSTEFLSDTFDNHVAQKPVSDLCHLCHRPKLCGLKQMDHSACLREDREGNMLTCASFLHLSWSARPTREDILWFHFQIRPLSSSFAGSFWMKSNIIKVFCLVPLRFANHVAI